MTTKNSAGIYRINFAGPGIGAQSGADFTNLEDAIEAANQLASGSLSGAVEIWRRAGVVTVSMAREFKPDKFTA